jgi:hypothetical protein
MGLVTVIFGRIVTFRWLEISSSAALARSDVLNHGAIFLEALEVAESSIELDFY